MTDNSFVDLTEDLRALAREPYGPVRTDLALAQRRGRRIRRRRRAAVCAGSAVALALVGTLVLPHGRQGDAATTPTRRSSPLVEEASFGWLPPGFGVTISTATQQPGAFTASAYNQNGTQSYVLTVFPQGPEPAADSHTTPVPAPPVNGRRAHWLKLNVPGGADPVLRFELSSGRWADLTINGLPRTANVNDAIYQVARSIKATRRPATFPLQIQDLPPAFTISRIYQSTDPQGPGWGTQLRFSPTLSIDVRRYSDVKQWFTGVHQPTTTINGHPAYRRTKSTLHPTTGPGGATYPAYQDTLCVLEVNNLAVCYDTTDPTTADKLAPIGGLPGLFRHTTIYGLNPTTWTPHPFT